MNPQTVVVPHPLQPAINVGESVSAINTCMYIAVIRGFC